MLKSMFKTIFLLSVVVIGGNTIALCQKVTSSMPEYMMLLTIVCFLTVAWSQVIKLVKEN